MRLKQLLVVFLPLMIFGAAVGRASGPQLTHISVMGHNNATTVTLRASHTFTHNEYRPTDNLLLVDLVGISAGRFAEQRRELRTPGVKSYHIIEYSGAEGIQIARLELTLEAHAQVSLDRTGEGLAIRVAPPAESGVATAPDSRISKTAFDYSTPKSAVDSSAGSPQHPAAQKVARRSPAAARPVKVLEIAVSRADGILVEVTADGRLDPRTMKLTSPDRFVVDFPDAVPGIHPKPLAIDVLGIKTVRMGCYHSDPPITRLVVDTTGPRDFEVVESGNKVYVRLRRTEAVPFRPSEPRPEGPGTPVPVETKLVMAAKAKLVAAGFAPASDAQGPADTGTGDLDPESKAGSPGAPDSGGQAANDFVVVQPKIQRHVSDKDPDEEPARPLVGANAAPATTPAMAAPLNQSAPASPLPPAAPLKSQKAVNFAAEQQSRPAGQAGPASTPPRYTGEPISVDLKDVDLKDFFRLIHEISGLNIVLDPNVSGSLTLVLNDVPWDQALDIVLKNNGLDRELDGNVLRIATLDTLRREAEARRKQREAQMLAVDKVTVTRFLSYAHSKDILPTIKRLLSSRGDAVADERSNGIIISDVPSVIPVIDSLLARLDRKTQQVEIEARVIAATRSFSQDIGTQLGFGWGNNSGSTSVGGTSQVGVSPNTVGYVAPPPYATSPAVTSSGGLQTTQAAIPLFSNLAALSPTSGLSLVNLGRNFRIDAILTAAEQRGLVKILSRPRVITQNNIQAVVKQGQQIPITTLGQLGGPPTVTYVQAVLRLTVTPQITIENTIFLNVDIENTTADFSNEIQGNPVFLTQQATTQVLVTNGGTVVIGGVIQSTNSVNIQQVPYLGSVPGLGNLFKRRVVNTSTQELIFFITPKIVET